MTLAEPLTERESEIVHLIAKGMSNREIARQLVVTTGTVKWHNRRIFSKLGVHNRTQAVVRAREFGFLEQISKQHPLFAVTPIHNLPAQVTSFVGRSKEIDEIKSLMRFHRLITLTGPGGSGKTRLALRVAEDILDHYEHGIFFVDLAPIREAQLLPSMIAQALGFWETPEHTLVDSLKRYLLDKRILLLLDNFEQVVESAPLVAELLSSSPGLNVLVTSRQILQIYGEQEFPVRPLSIPDLSLFEPLHVLSKYESLQLFLERATTVKLDFALTEQNAAIVAEICVRLDGLPLAIELAAARCKLFSPEILQERLVNRLGTLTVGARDAPTKLRTLRGTLDWSYDLLEQEERTLFARLSVFQGGCTLESAEIVCSSDLSIDMMDGLESLLNKNLLYHEQGFEGEPRFYMLETIREYAAERLEESGDAEDFHAKHAGYFARLAAKAESELVGPGQVRWIKRLRQEHDNLRAALSWSLGGADIVLGAGIACDLDAFWYGEGYSAGGLRWIEQALQSGEDIPPQVLARLYNTAGHLAFAKGDFEMGKRCNRQALAISQESGDQINCAWALIILAANMGANQDEVEIGITFCKEGLALFREFKHMPGLGRALNTLGELTRMVGDDERAKKAYEECIAIRRQMGNKQHEALGLSNLSYIAMHQGDYKRAEVLARERYTSVVDFTYKFHLGVGFAVLAGPIAAKGYPERAARLLGASEGTLQSLGAGLQPADKFEIDRYLVDVRNKLDALTFEKACAEGRLMSLGEAIAYAREDYEENGEP